MDMVERNSAEERRRERERAMMEEGKALWKIKMDEEKEIELRGQQQVRTFCVYSTLVTSYGRQRKNLSDPGAIWPVLSELYSTTRESLASATKLR